MKNIIILFIFCFLSQSITSQNYVPLIKNNTELNYICKLHGQTRTLSLTTKMIKDTLVFKLKTRGVKSNIVTMPEALKSGNELSYNQGEFSDVLLLKPTETFFMISKDAYQNLRNTGKFTYNNTTYVLDKSKDDIVINNKTILTLHVVAQIDKTEMWILKNSNFPLICKTTKNPLGINYWLTSINYK